MKGLGTAVEKGKVFRWLLYPAKWGRSDAQAYLLSITPTPAQTYERDLAKLDTVGVVCVWGYSVE